MKHNLIHGSWLPATLAVALFGGACSRHVDKPLATPNAAPKFVTVTGKAQADDVARFLAGKPVRHGEALSRLQQHPDYALHAQDMRNLWTTVSNLRLTPMQEWSREHIVPATAREHTLFYPFGGPDLIYAEAMFGHLRTKVLMGLEPLGGVPELESMDDTRLLNALPGFRRAMRFHLLAGYFDTKDMQSELRGPMLAGVTPILLTTVAMMGGTVDRLNNLPADPAHAIELRYHNQSGAPRTVIYVCGDLSNKGFAARRPLLDSFGRGATYFKAASYLLHDNSFSVARDDFLARSNAILQDDSGIPYRFLPPEQWRVRCFGVYQKPIPLFSQYFQADLRAAYQSPPADNLPFGAGYHYLPQSANLLFAVRR